MVLFYRLSGSLAAMSFAGAMFVIISYCSMPVLRKHPTNMVFFLSVSDLLFSLKFIITALHPSSKNLEEDGTTWCYMQAGWAQFWGLASISWIGMISFNLIIELHKQGFARTASYGKYYHVFVWSLSTITTAVMFGYHKYIGPCGDGTCWISQTGPNSLKLLFFVPLLVYFATSIFAVVLAFIRTSNGVMSDASRRGVMIRMTSYVAVFLLCWSLPLAHRIYILSHPNKPLEDPTNPSKLQLLDAVGVSIQGFANAMVWLSNPSFFVALKKHVIDKYLGCLTRKVAEKHPLLNEINNKLADSRHDITVIGQILRRNIITCILLGIQRSMRDLVRSDVTQKSYSDTRTYNYDELQPNELPDGQSQAFQFVDYSPLVFSHIRALSSVTAESYRESMNVAQFMGKITNEQLAKFSDGRSDSFFVFSPDKKFILKTISSQEAAVLLKMLPSLHNYFRANPHSLITRFYGCHAVRVSHGDLLHVVVMGNVFSSPLAIHECYDLKGSWVNRSVGIRTDPSKLGMDLDCKRKLKLDPTVKSMFLDQVQKDALLLCSLNIMDYSLLLGVHFPDRDPSPTSSASSIELVSFINAAENLTVEKLPGAQGLTQLVSTDQTQIYCVGIIDVLQLYDRKKKMERFFKVYLLHKDGQGLSSMPPQPYAKRFTNAMRNLTQF